jgi:hypothetical protein
MANGLMDPPSLQPFRQGKQGAQVTAAATWAASSVEPHRWEYADWSEWFQNRALIMYKSCFVTAAKK